MAVPYYAHGCRIYLLTWSQRRRNITFPEYDVNDVYGNTEVLYSLPSRSNGQSPSNAEALLWNIHRQLMKITASMDADAERDAIRQAWREVGISLDCAGFWIFAVILIINIYCTLISPALTLESI